jgi:hypothetical protein
MIILTVPNTVYKYMTSCDKILENKDYVILKIEASVHNDICEKCRRKESRDECIRKISTGQ